MGAAPKIEVFQNGQLLQEIPLQGEMWVGRDDACPVHLDDRAISRKHALFRMTPEGVEFENKSKFGWSKVNGQELGQATLKEGDRVEMGPYELRVKGLFETPKPSSVPVIVIPAPAPIALDATVPVEHEESQSVGNESPFGDFQANSEPELSVHGGEAPIPFESASSGAADDFGNVESDGVTRAINSPDLVKAVLFFGPNNANVEHFEVGNQEISIGRSQQCHVVLADKRSSRKHALIRREGKKYILKDLGSANGTQVNDARVENEIELNSGDRIQIGDTAFTFQMVQADYEQKKEQFINVPPHESEGVATPLMSSPMDHQQFQPLIDPINNPFGQTPPGGPAPSPTGFEAPPEVKKKSLLGKLLERYRMMSTKQQVIYGIVILGGLYLMLEDDGEPPKQAQVMKKQAKKPAADAKKEAGLPAFETLTQEQQKYIETQYQLGFDLYKNREYDKSIFEIEKIFRLVQDYKQAREIHSYAIEGKRKLEAREEERKRKEKEAQDRVKLQALVDQAGVLMEKKKYKEAEALFPDIELLEPENVTVGSWRKQIASENDRIEEERKKKESEAAIHKKAIDDFKEAMELFKKKEYYNAIDAFEDLEDRNIPDKKYQKDLKDAVIASYKAIAEGRDPWLAKAKAAEQSGNFDEAYRDYERAFAADPEDEFSPAGMKRIRGALQERAKSIYTEGVFAESFNDFDTAEKKYREVLEFIPKDDDYFLKATSRLKRITVFKKPVQPEAVSSGSNSGTGGVPR